MIVKVSRNVFIEVQFPRFSGDSVDFWGQGTASMSTVFSENSSEKDSILFLSPKIILRISGDLVDVWRQGTASRSPVFSEIS